MEEQRLRQRESEPKLHDYSWNEDRYLRWADLQKLFEKAPRVRRFNDMPWEQIQQALVKTYAGAEAPERVLSLKRAPILSVGARIQVIQPGGRSGNHRHFGEAVFYILEGKGHEVHDGKRYDWEAGDVVCVPTYCFHQHFVDSEGPATIFFCGRGCLAQSLNLGGMEQVELQADFKLPADAELLKDAQGRTTGYRRKDGVEIPLHWSSVSKEVMERKAKAARAPLKIETTYDQYIQQYWDESRWRETCPHVLKAKELPWENSRQGRQKYVVHPQIPFGLRTFDAFLQEIPPGGWSGKHCHVGEEVQFIIDGEGYSVLDGVRYDWGKWDVVCIPVMTTHQHFNSDSKRSALFISLQSRMYSFIGHGGVEHLEDASTYQAQK